MLDRKRYLQPYVLFLMVVILTPNLSENRKISNLEMRWFYGKNIARVSPDVVVDNDRPDSPEQLLKSLWDDDDDEVAFSHAQQQHLLHLHNLYRRNVTPPASDMCYMEWNEKLAKDATAWAKLCKFEHGFVDGSDFAGQNLYMGWDKQGVRAVRLWYEEYNFYDIHQVKCSPEKNCGHYTQMVWAQSRRLGCGVARCDNSFYVVCHYSPRGNLVETPPYKIGKPCSQCDIGSGGLCHETLCVTEATCKKEELKCHCHLRCHNCGVLNTKKCACSCKDGWDSLDCSQKCVDSHEYCGKNPGWPNWSSCFINKGIVGKKYCRKMCKKCKAVNPKNLSNTCCEGALCDDKYVLDLENSICSCKPLCPSTKCSGTSRTEGCSILLFVLWWIYTQF